MLYSPWSICRWKKKRVGNMRTRCVEKMHSCGLRRRKHVGRSARAPEMSNDLSVCTADLGQRCRKRAPQFPGSTGSGSGYWIDSGEENRMEAGTKCVSFPQHSPGTLGNPGSIVLEQCRIDWLKKKGKEKQLHRAEIVWKITTKKNARKKITTHTHHQIFTKLGP